MTAKKKTAYVPQRYRCAWLSDSLFSISLTVKRHVSRFILRVLFWAEPRGVKGRGHSGGCRGFLVGDVGRSAQGVLFSPGRCCNGTVTVTVW